MSDIVSRRQRSPWLWPDFIYTYFSEGRDHDKTLKVLHSFTYKVSNGAGRFSTLQKSWNCSEEASLLLFPFIFRWSMKELRTCPATSQTAKTTKARGNDGHFWTCSWAPPMKTAARWAMRTSRRKWTPLCFGLVVKQWKGILKAALINTFILPKKLHFVPIKDLLSEIMMWASYGRIIHISCFNKGSLKKSLINSLYLQGHDTTAAAMNWALHLLGSHPEVHKKVQQELQEVFGNNNRLYHFNGVVLFLPEGFLTHLCSNSFVLCKARGAFSGIRAVNIPTRIHRQKVQHNNFLYRWPCNHRQPG